ncbi:MAG: flagellar biosynthesis protein FlhF [Phycisphaerales bacterium]|nr:flagellar biosynthesis protein FlhF [Phycisphaerales bacterium]
MPEMTLKTYRARTMGDALAEVKKDLGKDAVILHTRAYKVGAWLGFGGRPIVEITASTTPSRGTGGPSISIPPPRSYGNPASTPPHSQGNGSAGRARDSFVAAIPRGSGDPPAPPIPTAVCGTGVPPVSTPTPRPRADLSAASTRPAAPSDSLERELDSIKRMVSQVLRNSRQSQAATLTPGLDHDALVGHYLRLLEAEVAGEIADEVMSRVRDELSSGEMRDDGVVHETVLRHLAAIIPSGDDVPRPAAEHDGRPLTIALVGPTGVGKTTTIAKLAAAYKLRHGKRVALVTIDTYRIAAVDQLRTYAEIIGLPLRVALTPTDMASACESLRDHDVVLIDTAGRSPADAGRICELRLFLAAAQPHQTHLVLSGTSSEAVMIDAAAKFSAVTPDRVIFTKLDEAVNYGVLFGVARRIALRLSYVTTGQEVPDHIEMGRPDRLARLVLDGSRAR